MEIKTDGKGGQYADLLRRYAVAEMPHEIPIRVETLDKGMQSGAPSLAFHIEMPSLRKVILAQTSVKLFQLCAAATLARYGDMTEGGMLGKLVNGSFEVTLSRVEKCPGCRNEIPGSCRFCPECGVRL